MSKQTESAVARWIARDFRALLGATSAAVYRIEGGRADPRIVAVSEGRRRGEWPPRLLAATLERIARARGGTSWRDPLPGARHGAGGRGRLARFAVPLRTGARVTGLLVAAVPVGRRLSAAERARAAIVAAQASVALEQARQVALLAADNARLHARATAVAQRVRALSGRLIEAQEAERRHIARELHDEVGQALTAARMNLDLLEEAATDAAVRGRLDESRAIVDRILRSIRQLSLDLRPPALDDLGLVAALRAHAHAQADRAGLELDLSIDDLPAAVPTSVATACFRLAQEAITNVLRHAGATRLYVSLAQEGTAIALTVRDDGNGFDVAGTRGHVLAGATLGLLAMEERAALAGGTLEIKSEPKQGTRVRAVLPLAPPLPPKT